MSLITKVAQKSLSHCVA